MSSEIHLHQPEEFEPVSRGTHHRGWIVLCQGRQEGTSVRQAWDCLSYRGPPQTSCHLHGKSGQAARALWDASLLLLTAGRWAVTHSASPWERNWHCQLVLKRKSTKYKAPGNLLATPRPALDILPSSPHTPSGWPVPPFLFLNF